MRGILCSIVPIFGLSALGLGQAPSPPTAPAFEVASVKPNTGNSNPSSQFGKGLVRFANMPARMLIVTAYGLRPDRVVGGPSWIDSEGFDVTARAAADTPTSRLMLMLRSLLAERFKLIVRTEKRDQPIYALGLARADGRLGPNLKPSTECTPSGFIKGQDLSVPLPQVGVPLMCGLRSVFRDGTGAVIQGGAVTLANLAGTLDGTGGRNVVDRTGLTGTYDIDLRFARTNLQPVIAGDSNLPSVFTAVEEQLGLKLESQTGLVDFVVVDRIERPSPD